jgi:hypothetical protein
MKILKVILLITICFLFSCNKKYDQNEIEKSIDSIKVHNQNQTKKEDTVCLNEEKRAEKDIQSGKLVYFYFRGKTKMYRSNKEMKTLLSAYKIEIDSALLFCIPDLNGFERNCYASKMGIAIEKKYGNEFINTLRNLAEIQFVLNNPNIVFKFEECDTTSRYPNTKNYSDNFKKPKEDFEKQFAYPKDYKFKSGKYFSSTQVYFILDKNGKINNIETHCSFRDSVNYKFTKYFKNEAVKFVQKTKWIPAKFKGINVNSEMNFLYFHK